MTLGEGSPKSKIVPRISSARVARETLPGGTAYSFRYGPMQDAMNPWVEITGPQSEAMKITLLGNSYNGVTKLVRILPQFDPPDSLWCKLVHMSIASVGSIAPLPSWICWILPSLSTTNVVRLANCICSFRMPYSFETCRVMSLSSGNLTPIFSANAWLEGGASMLMPRTSVSFRSILPESIPAWYA
jgi:hypothetical protein